MVHYRKGQTILCEGEAAERCFRVLSGVVRAYRLLHDGRRQIVEFLFPNDVFGFAPGGQYGYSADAVTAASLQSFGSSAVERLGIEQPALAARLRDSVYQELRTAQNHIVMLGRKTASERVASFLLTLSQRARAETRDGNTFWVPMSQSDIADYLGLTAETVNRVVAQLREAGTISIPTRGILHVNQPRALEQMADAA